MVTLAADVGAVPENHLAAFRRPAAASPSETQPGIMRGARRRPAGPSRRAASHSQDGVVPEHADGLRALLGGDQAKLHRDGLVQRVLQQLVVVVHRDADHRRVDDRTLRHAAAK